MSALATTVIKVDRVRAVQVGISRNINGLGIQEHALIVVRVEAERIAMLPKTVDVGVVGKRSPEAHILLFKDHGNGAGIKENLAVIFALDLERKWFLLDIKLESRVGRGRFLVLWTRKDIFLDLENLEIGIVNLDVEAVV